jgi:hypothetical protein
MAENTEVSAPAEDSDTQVESLFTSDEIPSEAGKAQEAPPESNPCAAGSAEQESEPRDESLSIDINNEILSWCEKAELPAVWGFLGDDDCPYRLMMSTSGLFGMLLERYGPAALIAAGVIREFLPPNRVIPCAALANDPVLFSVRRQRGEPVEFYIREGALFNKRMDIWDYAQQTGVPPSGAPHDVLVCGSWSDVRVLGKLGYSAVEAGALETLTKVQVDRLFDPHVPNWTYRMQLIDWSIANLSGENDQAIQGVIQRLHDVQLAYGFDPHSRFRVSRPTPEGLRAVTSAASFADKDAVAAAIEKTFLSPAGHWSDYLSSSLTLSQAKRHLRELRRQPRDRLNENELAQAAAQVRRIATSRFAEPLDSLADQATDPMTAMMLDDAAEIAREHVEGQLCMIQANKILAGDIPSEPPLMDAKWINERIRRHAAIRSLLRPK